MQLNISIHHSIRYALYNTLYIHKTKSNWRIVFGIRSECIRTHEHAGSQDSTLSGLWFMPPCLTHRQIGTPTNTQLSTGYTISSASQLANAINNVSPLPPEHNDGKLGAPAISVGRSIDGTCWISGQSMHLAWMPSRMVYIGLGTTWLASSWTRSAKT